MAPGRIVGLHRGDKERTQVAGSRHSQDRPFAAVAAEVEYTGRAVMVQAHLGMPGQTVLWVASHFDMEVVAGGGVVWVEAMLVQRAQVQSLRWHCNPPRLSANIKGMCMRKVYG